MTVLIAMGLWLTLSAGFLAGAAWASRRRWVTIITVHVSPTQSPTTRQVSFIGSRN